MNIDPKLISEVLSKETEGEEVIEAVVVGDNVIINTIMYVSVDEFIAKCKSFVVRECGEVFFEKSDSISDVIKVVKWVIEQKDKAWYTDSPQY